MDLKIENIEGKYFDLLTENAALKSQLSEVRRLLKDSEEMIEELQDAYVSHKAATEIRRRLSAFLGQGSGKG